jgi:hypothetical protein
VMDPRTTSFFLEPSFLGGFAATMFVMGLSEYFYDGHKRSLALSTVSAYVILTSESTVGLALIPFGLIVAVLFVAGSRPPSPQDGQRPALRRRIQYALLGLMCAMVLFAGEHVADNVLGPLRARARTQSVGAEGVGSPTAAATVPQLPPSPSLQLSQPTPLPVQPSSSGPAPWLLDLGSRPWADRLLSVKYRLWADEFSIFGVAKATLFLGAGLGSNRPSSFLAYVASNVGIPGLLSIGSFLALIAVCCLQYRGKLQPPALPICAAMYTYVLAMFGGLPDPSWPPFLWIFGGLAVAGLGLAAGSIEGGTPVSNVD